MALVPRVFDQLLQAADRKEALEEYIETELEQIETDFQQSLETNGTFLVRGIGLITPMFLIQFLILEEFHPMQGFRWLAVKQLAHDCSDEHSRLSSWDIINYASKRGYCRG
ncbi:hypothetical protein [Endozoicomonas sp.]|uniref:hypothetical protein n=1 Tax=Endozoicomonas sp. TaxID=1892382 RepID=UPI003AF975CE